MGPLLRHLLAHRSFPIISTAIAVLLVLPSLSTGWQQDDLVQRYSLLGNPDLSGDVTSPLDLFSFLNGDPLVARGMMNAGFVPWWTLPTIRLSFWRPLSSATHWFDYVVWQDSSLLMHLHNVAWFAGFVLLGGMLYRRILGKTWVAGLALLLFALDDAHGFPAGWIANRNGLIAGVFGCLALILHDRWRRGWRSGGAAGPALFSLGLLAGESALAVFGYLLAYALFIEEGAKGRRALSLLPYAAIAGVWLFWYNRLGYGAWGSGFYVDPISEPLRFLGALAWKGPLLLADQWGLPPSSLALFMSPPIIAGLVAWGGIVLTLVWILLRPLLRSSKRARFWAAGMLLSIPLVCSTMPHSRLLMFAGIGAFGLLAEWFGGWREKAEWLPGGKLWRVMAAGFAGFSLVVHLLIGPLLLMANSTSAAFSQKYIQDAAGKVDGGPELNGQTLVIVNHPIVFYGHYFRTARFLQGVSYPRRLRVLGPATSSVEVVRIDERSLLLKPERGFLGGPFENVFRGEKHHFRAGERVLLEGMEVEIGPLTPDGRPAQAIFRFAVPLTDPTLRWLWWEGEGYAQFVPPAIGESVTLPAAPPLF